MEPDSQAGAVSIERAPLTLSFLWSDHIRPTLKLAGPIIVARAGMMLFFTADTMMTGWAGSDELAYLGLGVITQFVMLVFGMGMLQGTMILISQAFGAGDYAECGKIWRIGILHALAFTVLFVGITLLTEEILLLMSQSPDAAAGAQRVAYQFAWGMPAMLIYMVSTFFVEGINRPSIGMVAVIVANLVNIALNGMLIHGYGGLVEPMGAEGAVMATSAVRWLSLGIIGGYILTLPWREGRDQFAVFASADEIRREVRTLGFRYGQRMRRLGFPMGLAQALDTGAMAGMHFMAGTLGNAALAAYQVTMNVNMLGVLAAMGIGGAATVRVGNAVGRGDQGGIRLACWTGAGLSAAVVFPFAVFQGVAPEYMAGFFNRETAVLAITAYTIVIGAAMLIPQVIYQTMMGALRGCGDVWIPTYFQIGVAWLISVPVGYYLAFFLGWGVPGLFLGTLTASLVSLSVMIARFHWVSGRHVVRV